MKQRPPPSRGRGITWCRGRSCSAAPRRLVAARDPGTPIGCGGRSRAGGLGWHPESREVARKLKGAARRRGARVPGGGPSRGGERASSARTDAAACGGHGRESRPPLLPPRRLPRPLWHRCSRGLEPPHLRAYELDQVRPPRTHPRPGVRARGRGHGGGGAQWRPSLVPAVCALSVQLAAGLRVGHSRRAPGSCCSHMERAAGDERWAGTGPDPRAPPECGPRGAGAGTSAPFALYCPWRVPPALGGGVWSTRKSPFFSLGASLPRKTQGNTLARLSARRERWGVERRVGPVPGPGAQTGCCDPAGAKRPLGDARAARPGPGPPRRPATPPRRDNLGSSPSGNRA